MNIADLLLQEASKSYIKHKISCIVIHRNKIIAKGYNRGLVHCSNLHCCPLRG